MNRPPPALGCTHVIEFAINDKSVTFEQRHTLNVGGEWLCETSNLAICQDFKKKEFLIFHCNSEWEVLGVAAGYDSIQEAKYKIECSYHGITEKWVASDSSLDEAIKYVENQLKDQSCSFCGRTPLQFQAVAGDTVRICNFCVDSFHYNMGYGIKQ